MVHNIELE